MSDPRWERQWELFHDALAHAPGARREWLERTCADDPELAAEVDALLAAHASAPALIDAAARSPTAATDVPETFGAWRVVREIGRGGMGRVFEVLRADGRYEQRAALKLLDPLLTGTEFIHRFRAERRILARLEHPDIARLLDAGEDAQGRPWLVMEYVDGEPIDRWCRERALTLMARVALVIRVADAVAHAHRQLVVHRDIKPGNVLVEASGRPVLLDFGIAKDLDDGSATEVGAARPLTPRYASPEQLAGQWVGPASDVWSLGVLLHELIVGAPPHAIAGLPLQAAAERIAREGPPDVVALARRRGVRVPAEIGWVVARAMATEPARRYADAQALADDLRAVLAHRPVAARAPGALYVLRKFVRRRWAAVATAASILVLAAAFVAGLSAEAARTRAALAASEAQRRHAERVSAFLAQLFDLADTTRDGGAGVDARTLLERGRTQLDAATDLDPLARARMTYALATTFRNLGAYDEARGLLESALPAADAADPALALDLRQTLASVLDLAGEQRAARDLLGEVLAARGAVPTPDPAAMARTELQLAAVQQALGAHRVAGELFEAARARVAAGAGDVDLGARVALGVGSWHWTGGRLDEAGRHYADALALRRAERPPNLAELARALDAVGAQAHARGDHARALPAYTEALALRRQVLGARHRLTADSLSNLGACHYDRGDDAAAVPLLREALAVYEQTIDADSPVLAKTLNNLGLVLARSGDPSEARALIARALDIHRRAYGDRHARVAGNLNNLGLVDQGLGDLAAAATNYAEALAIQREVLPAAHPQLGYTLTNLGRVRWLVGDRVDAERLLREALEVRRSALPDDAPVLADTRNWLGWVLCSASSTTVEGAGLLEQSLAVRRARAPVDRTELARSALALDACRLRAGLPPLAHGIALPTTAEVAAMPAPMRAMVDVVPTAQARR